MYKMIVSDLDRTLLNDNKEISEYSKAVLKRCHKLGYKIVFATARPKRAITAYLKEIDVDGVIIHNGSLVYFDDEVVAQYGIKLDEVKELLKVVNSIKENYGISIEMEDRSYSNIDTSNLWKNNIVHYSKDFSELPEGLVDKMIVHFDDVNDSDLIKAHLPSTLYYEISEGVIGLIMNKKANKAHGVKKLCGLLGIELSEVVAFGDDLNDQLLLSIVGKGVAMRNAIDVVKEVSDEITLSNNENGVAKWLEVNLLS